jgi:hypothetical protein
MRQKILFPKMCLSVAQSYKELMKTQMLSYPAMHGVCTNQSPCWPFGKQFNERGTFFVFSLPICGFTNFWPLVIYFSSYADICACSPGVPDIAGIHTNTQRNPNNPNTTKGPKIPVCLHSTILFFIVKLTDYFESIFHYPIKISI